jgi:hypothetical protein
MLHDPLVPMPVQTPGAGAVARTPLRRISLRRIPIGVWLFLALVVAALVAGITPGNVQNNSRAVSAPSAPFKAAGGYGDPTSFASKQGPTSRLVQESHIEKDAQHPIQQMPAVSHSEYRARTQQGGSAAPVLVPGLDPGSLLTNLWTTGIGGLIDFVKTQFLDWASSFGFVYITPAALSYKLLTIKNASAWSIGVVDGAIALILVIGGYQVIMRHHLGLPTGWVMEQLSHLALTAVIANVGFFYVLPQLIELNNSLCISLWMAFGHAGVGDFSLPLGVVNWMRQPFTIGLFVVIDFVLSLLLVIVQLVRLGLLDVLIVFAPLGIMCAALPHTRAFFRLWVVGFFCTLFVQVLQVGAIALGSALIVSFGPASTTPIIILVGIATTYIAFRLPHMLLSGALRTSVGSIGRDVGTAVTGIVNLVGFSRV